MVKDFYNFYIERVRDIKVSTKRKDPSKDPRLKVVRGIDRKHLNQVPDYRKLDVAKSSIERVLDRAKGASRGIWPVSKRQVIDIANKYKFFIPNDHYPTKHLGSTGIILWRKEPNRYYLIKKRKQHYHRRQ